MKTLVLVLLFPVSALATPIQVDFFGYSVLPSPLGPPGADVNVSMRLDTSALSSVSYSFGERDGNTCVSDFSAAFAINSASVSYAGNQILSGAGTVATGGGGRPACSGFFSGFGANIGGESLFLSFDLNGAYTRDQFLTSNDPIFDLLQLPPSAVSFAYSGKEIFADARSFSIHAIPEPATIALLGLGLFGMNIAMRRRIVVAN